MANNEYTISKIGLPNGDICNIKDTTYNFNTAYNATTNKAATMADIKTDNIKPIKSASFNTGKYGQDGSGTHYYEMLGSITPTSFEQMWLLHYIITIEVPSDTTYTYRADVEIYGVRNTYGAYKIFNSYYSKYPIYQHVILEGASSSYPHEFGYRLASSYGDTTVNKNIHIDIIETRNCTAAFFNAPKAYTSATPSNYVWRGFNATSNGLQETGDADTITRLYMGNNGLTVGSTLRLTGSSIFGLDRDNCAQGISLYTNNYDSTTTSISTTRVYNTAGFDWTKGLFYNTGGNYNVNTVMTPGIDQSIHAIDFRYTDNCVASSSLTTLGLERLKPVYLKGTIGTNGLFYLAPFEITYNSTTYKRVWTQDIPTTNDGYIYWFLGFPYYNGSYAGGYQLNFYLENKLFWYHNGKFQEYIGDAVTVNGHTVNKDVPSDAKFTDNNTTYTFENGTNGFKVTPSGGSAQTVTVTPSITNNVTGSGTNGYLAKFNGTNTITSGPQLGSSTTTFLRNDGTWATALTSHQDISGKVNKSGDTMTNSLTISKAGECGVEVNNTQSTNPNQVAFIVGSSGNGGIYSRKHSKWIVYSDASGNVVLNGNANTASAVALSGVTGADDLKAIEALSGTSGFLKKTAANTWTLDTTSYAALASPTFTGTPKSVTPSSSSDSKMIATKEYVDNAFAANDAMIFKGTIGSSGATITALPATHNVGWTYRVITAGTYANVKCEIGDLIICITDGTSANDAHWTVAQTNIDGAVTGPASSTANHFVLFNDTTGKVVKDSGVALNISSGSTTKWLTERGTWTTPTAENIGAVATSAGVTAVTWTDNKLTRTINGTAADVVTISTIKTALSLAKADVGLSNVTNHAQVTSLQWDTTNKKLTYKVSEGTAANLLTFIAGSNISLTAETNKITIANTYSYTLPLAASGTRGGIQVGYTTSGTNYAVQLSNEKAYVSVPWTDTKVKQTIQTNNANYKLLTTTSASPSSGSAAEAYYSTYIYANPSTSSVSAGRHTLNLNGSDKAYMVWNDTDQSIDFIFN